MQSPAQKMFYYGNVHFTRGSLSQLLRRETSCFDHPRSGFTGLSSIFSQGKILKYGTLCII